MKLREKFIGTITCFIFVGATVIANYTILNNTLNSYIEFNFVRTQLAKCSSKKISRIHLIRAKPIGRGFNNKLSSHGDEFNLNSTGFPQDIHFIIREALIELKPKDNVLVFPCSNDEKCISSAPLGYIIVTNSAFDESIAVASDAVIIDMNDLLLNK